MQIRVPSLYIPKSFYNGDTTVAQDIEPEHVTISGDGSRAWVTIRVRSCHHWLTCCFSAFEDP
ncbi:hypothetical protein DPMN_115192 [Dreissena polymorpha]|uniref:Uncharacterized protein n=1 Tax=Dreissena polymorpha TaxID=45954 RepID=A0A9D4KKU4_DREPO|nr:hypothetical protein DPMN_115192 [Dreissena polymorpha]